MNDLSTQYLGLQLKNPVIAASSGLTGTLDSIVQLEKSGAAAVVLKSIFEEEILLDVNLQLKAAQKDPMIFSQLTDSLEYIDLHIKENRLNEYLDLIEKAKNAVSIPIIASINCVSLEDWTHFTRKIEDAGADGLELNLFLNPADFENKEFEKVYFRIIDKVLAVVDIPVTVKISRYLTRMGLTVKALSDTGISGLVIFNRFYTPDIDINTQSMGPGKFFTTSQDLSETLRWTAIMSGRLNCDLAATTGIHTGDDAIKILLAGATVIQVASTLYTNGPDQLGRILKKLEKWMEEKEYGSIDEFRGKVSREYGENPAAFERMQFMKYFGEIR